MQKIKWGDFTENQVIRYTCHAIYSDTTDSAVIRLVTNDPKQTAQLLKSRSISFTERKIIAVQIKMKTPYI